MVRFEMRYLTYSKCPIKINIISDVSPLFCTRIRIFDELATWILFRSRFDVIKTWCFFPFPYEVRIFWNDTLTFFWVKFRVLDDLVTSLLFCTRFEVIFLSSFAWGLGMVLFLFHSRFEMILEKWYFYPLPREFSIFFWETMLLSSFARGLEHVSKTILLSSSFRGFNFLMAKLVYLTGFTLDMASFSFLTKKNLPSWLGLHLNARLD